MSSCPCCQGALEYPGWGPEALKRCGRCGSAFLPQEAKAYDASYFDGSGGVDYESSKRQFQLINHRRLDWISRFAPKGGKLFEAGCALGFFLEAAEERSWQGYGVEISPFASQKAQERFGQRVITGVLEQAPADWKAFDLACGFHVLEHVPGPEAMVKELGERLKDGALLAWEVPDFGSSVAQRSKEKWQYFLPGEHLNYFTLEGLVALHRRHGFELVYSKSTSFTRLLGGVDKAGLKNLREFILRYLRWLSWVKGLVLWLKGLSGAHDCVFVLFRKCGAQ